jgi:hypothetical protein
MKNTHNLFFSEKRFIYMNGLSTAPRGVEKVPTSVCKKADSRYFNMIKNAGKLNARKFQKRLKRSVLPKEVKKAAIKKVTETKFLYPTTKAFNAKVAKVAKKLLKLVKNDNMKIKPDAVDDLRAQAQSDIKTAAQKAAGFNEASSEDITVSTNRMAQYKGIVSQMNGKVSKTKLLYVAKNYKAIAVDGVDAAITRNTQGMVQAKIRKHMTKALNA